VEALHYCSAIVVSTQNSGLILLLFGDLLEYELPCTSIQPLLCDIADDIHC